jgi:t-SNARE complex subunit (syntaxin)
VLVAAVGDVVVAARTGMDASRAVASIETDFMVSICCFVSLFRVVVVVVVVVVAEVS